ncbi:MAG: FadR/GntR family transcriptional regulator, partial [Anaerolineae bacterium]
MKLTKLDSKFLEYLIENQIAPGDRLPSISKISSELGISPGKLREQLEVARHMGLVSARPRLGMRREPFDFLQLVLAGILFSLEIGEASFAQISQLRVAIETQLWHDAVTHLTAADKDELQALIAQAWDKLRGEPIHIPNHEHRQLHLKLFSRIDNPFVKGLLEAYWEAYEASELTRFATYNYWLKVCRKPERCFKVLTNRQDIARQ